MFLSSKVIFKIKNHNGLPPVSTVYFKFSFKKFTYKSILSAYSVNIVIQKSLYCPKEKIFLETFCFMRL